jgi:hypothetical protein
MQIRHDTDDIWWVAAKWPDGRSEDIKGFSSETDANEWIAKELNEWLENRNRSRSDHGEEGHKPY